MRAWVPNTTMRVFARKLICYIQLSSAQKTTSHEATHAYTGITMSARCTFHATQQWRATICGGTTEVSRSFDRNPSDPTTAIRHIREQRTPKSLGRYDVLSCACTLACAWMCMCVLVRNEMDDVGVFATKSFETPPSARHRLSTPTRRVQIMVQVFSACEVPLICAVDLWWFRIGWLWGGRRRSV